MNHQLARVVTSLVILLSVYATPSKADTELEGKFEDVFVTAGYSAAAGAAIGAALLTFQDEPIKHLVYLHGSLTRLPWRHLRRQLAHHRASICQQLRSDANPTRTKHQTTHAGHSSVV